MDSGLQALREAARLSPDNLPLRRHLAQQLLAHGYLADAEAEFRAVLMLAPRDVEATAGLAEVFVRQSAYGEALAALEPLLAAPDSPPRLGVLAARALLGEGDIMGAAERYRNAVTRDPSVADPDLAARLTPPASPTGPEPSAAPPGVSPPQHGTPTAGTSTPPYGAPATGTPAPAYGASAVATSTSPYGASAVATSAPPYGAPAAGTPAPPYGTSTPPPSSAYPGPPSSGGPAYAERGSAEVERSQITFADVAGMDAVKESLRMKLLMPVLQPQLFAAFGKRSGGGVLLYGPPGAGKTHLARAAAGELGAAFVSVGLADILDMYVGSSERNLRAVFDLARRNRPCVLFFDEVDALAARRSDMRNTHNRQIVNQFLSELDGVEQDANEGVLVLAATNAPWYIDVAFRRPGRFDQMVFVPPPDAQARAAILRILCRDKPLAEMDFNAVAAATEDFTGADLKGVVDRAVEIKLHESMRAGRPVPLTTADLMAVVRTVQPTAVREWLATARNYVMHANDSGAWDELMPWIRKRR
ncbi:AAA family ATPase [Thermostaphylospora chromogena]|uniref:ATPase family associated with various cellular activities (AAA) n=1 Tax=Thermostaphylospora chromogena TaxID=35622 RepID=A0A1H1C040_9ACTN|nr:AAA family ATPase [Thermostaphylospora chromogena]SDQ57555.1 ATPase family associated with various cellular activities (AAA) [Thermostaphylospora chromogena]